MTIYLAGNYSSMPVMQERAAKIERETSHKVGAAWISGAHDNLPNLVAARLDLEDIDASDALIFFSLDINGKRTRGGKHVEFGYALARGKKVFVVGEPQTIFHYLPQVVQRDTLDDLIPILRTYDAGIPEAAGGAV